MLIWNISSTVSSDLTFCKILQLNFSLFAFRVSRRQCKMCIGHMRLCVCPSPYFPGYCTGPDITWGNGRGCPLVVHWSSFVQMACGWASTVRAYSFGQHLAFGVLLCNGHVSFPIVVYRVVLHNKQHFLTVPPHYLYRRNNIWILQCWPMLNVMAALPNIGGALYSTPQSLADAHY